MTNTLNQDITYSVEVKQGWDFDNVTCKVFAGSIKNNDNKELIKVLLSFKMYETRDPWTERPTEDEDMFPVISFTFTDKSYFENNPEFFIKYFKSIGLKQVTKNNTTHFIGEIDISPTLPSLNRIIKKLVTEINSK